MNGSDAVNRSAGELAEMSGLARKVRKVRKVRLLFGKRRGINAVVVGLLESAVGSVDG